MTKPEAKIKEWWWGAIEDCNKEGWGRDFKLRGGQQNDEEAIMRIKEFTYPSTANGGKKTSTT